MGRYFDIRYEQESIDSGVEEQQQETGGVVSWFFWDPSTTEVHDIYDEGFSGGGGDWCGPYPVPYYSVTRSEGAEQQTGDGFYTVDTLVMWLSYRQAANSGLLPPVDTTNSHLKDRFVFDGKVWSPTAIVARNLLGGGGTRSMVVVAATEVKDDELVNDADFMALYGQAGFQQADPGHVSA